MTDYEEIMGEYSSLKTQKKIIEDRLEAIKENIEDLMHRDGRNEISVDSQDGKMWNCKYQESTRKKVDYTVLRDIVSDQDYNMIVSESFSESLVIRESKSTKPKKIKRGAPNSTTPIKTPQGTIGSQNIPLV